MKTIIRKVGAFLFAGRRFAGRRIAGRRPQAAYFALAVMLAAALTPPAGAAPARTNFDHLTTGFELIGQHRDLQCETCHANAVFKGTPKECASCHGVGTTVRATAKPLTHIVSTERCEACHTPIAWKPSVSFDHLEVRGSCSTCHDGNHPPAQGQGPAHIVTSLECDACHSTIGWGGAVFNHEGVTGNCKSCHNGVKATGKPAKHVPLIDAPQFDCSDCHSKTNFTTFVMSNVASAMNHGDVLGTSCATCHEKGLTWVGAPPTVVRPATKASGQPHTQTGDCNVCHFNTTSFKGATDLPSNHIPLPTADNGNCALCHSNGNDYSVATMNHVNIGSNCIQCHATGKAFANMAPPTLVEPAGNHIPTTQSCETCHSASNFATGAFNTATMNHAGITGGCAQCHDAGKTFANMAPPTLVQRSGTHLPTTQSCETCHSKTDFSVGAFNNATMSHFGITSGCAACHATGKTFDHMAPPTLKEPPTNHIPFAGANCESCHSATNFTSFVMTNNGADMNHTVVTSIACSTCHETGTSWAGTPATVVRPALKANGQKHVPSGECNTCHFNTTSFKGASDLPNNHIPLPAGDNNDCSICHSNVNDYSIYVMSHANITGNCTQCHGSGKAFANMAPPTLIEPAGNHLPTTQSCETCHSASSFGTGAFNTATMSHAGITSGCATCHAAGKTFANMAPPTLVQPAGNHIPTTTACENCHSNSNFATGAFNAATMSHAGITSGCAACHAAGSSFANMAPPTLKEPPANHIPFAGAACESCHSPSVFTNFIMTNNDADMNHTVVTSLVCSTCHEAGKTWAGTPATVVRPALKASGAPHVVSGECSTCHFNTTSFKGASDLPNGHIPIPAADNSNCTLCHSNASDYSIYAMNHVNITSNCTQCHGAGLSFTNMAPPALVEPAGNHIPTTQSCETCHSASSFATGGFNSATMNHTGITSGCATCHANGKTFANLAPPTLVVAAANHIPTTQSCETCHSATTFTTGAFNSATMSHTGITSGCATCHATGSTFANMAPPTLKVPPTSPAHVPFGTAACESCHSASVFTSFTMTNNATDMNHTVVTATVCSTCHEKGKVWVGSPATVVRPALKANGQAHVTGGECSTCHFNTTSFKGATDLPANHLPLPAADNNNCALCHLDSSTYSTATMNHVNITSNCTQCHAVGSSFANMAPPTLIVPAGNHIPTTQSCETCHAAGNFATGAFNSATMNHAGITSGCASCHATGSTFANMAPPTLVVAASNHIPTTQSCETCHSASNFATGAFNSATMSHTGISSGCATCHAAGSTFANMAPPTLKVPPTSPAHVPFGTAACESCHSASVFTSFTMTNNATDMNHTVVTSTVCSTCHEAGKVWVGSPATVVRPALKANGQAHVTGGECSNCHFNTTSFKGATDYPSNHIPVPTADNNNCTLCHSNANDYSVYAMNHVNITSNCLQCHAAGSSFANMAPPTLKVPSTNHIPTTQSCETCHSASNFATGAFNSATMNHTGITSGCATCHANGKTFTNLAPPTLVVAASNHIPTTQSCETCHSASNFATGAFNSATMSHTGISSGCAACHATGLTFANMAPPTLKEPPTNHIPFASAACESCHSKTVFTSFAMTNNATDMNHTVVTSLVCSTCHEAGKTWVGTPATVVRPALKPSGQPHVTGGECSTCHFSTTSFAGATDLPANHIPLPTADNGNCALCHTNTNDYSVYTMNHVNITSNCAQCHAYGLSFANIAAPTLKQPTAGATGHIPSNPPNGTAAIACESCHTATVFTTFSGTVMKHAYVTSMKCMSCHEYGMKWQTNKGVQLWVRDSPNHHAGQDCNGSGCHSSRDKRVLRPAAVVASKTKTGAAATAATQAATQAPSAAKAGATIPANMLSALRGGMLGGVAINHASVAGTSCVSCHNAAHGLGKDATHPATTDNCAGCHTTLAWLPVSRVDHSQVRGTCVSCHNGKDARAKSLTHVASGSACETCHTTNAWTPARFDHTTVSAGSCKTCHDGVHAPGVSVSHIATKASCDACHGTLGWTPVKVDHRALTQGCASCHNGGPATGVTATHMSTRKDCATCHVYPNWTPVVFTHTSAAYPGNHHGSLTCVNCHTTNADTVPYPYAADAGSCGGCHTKDFKSASHPKVAGGANYTASELKNCSGACHVYSDATLRGVAHPQPGPYHRVTDAAFKH